METKELKKLIQLLEASNLESLSYKGKDFEFEIKKPSMIQGVQSQTQSLQPSSVIPVETMSNQSEGTIVKSPLVGIFYSKPSVDANPFVSLESTVKVGEPLCVLEAMKVMNEIKSDVGGKIVEIYVKDGEAVDFDQPLFRIV